MGPIIISTGTVFYSLLYSNSQRGVNGLWYVYSVISVIVDLLPGNTKNRHSTRSWTANAIIPSLGGHMNESCPFTYTHINGSRLRVVAHMSESCPHTYTHEWVMAWYWHIWMCHVLTHTRHALLTRTHMYIIVSDHTCGWLMSHLWMSHVKFINESRHPYTWVTSCAPQNAHRLPHAAKPPPYEACMVRCLCVRHVMSHVTRMNESCHTCAAGRSPHAACTMRCREVGGWGRVPFSRNLMSPTPRRKWYLTTGRRFH